MSFNYPARCGWNYDNGEYECFVSLGAVLPARGYAYFNVLFIYFAITF